MSRNKRFLPLLLALCLFAGGAGAESLISDEMIRQETVNYRATATVERGVFERGYSAPGSEYYPYTYVLRFEGDDARFVEYRVSRKDEVKAGDVLATFELDVDEVALATLRQQLQRAREAYAAQQEKQRLAIQEQKEAFAQVSDPIAREIAALQLQRAQISLEKYCLEQERHIASLQQELDDMEEANRRTSLIAPCDGVVTEIAYKQSGTRLHKGEILITLCRTDHMLLRITNTNGYFRYGMEVDVAAGPAKARTMLRGRVVAADLLVPQSQQTGYAYVALDPLSGEYPTRGVQPSITGATYYLENVLILPRRAYEMDSGKYLISKLAGGAVEKRYINVAMQGIETAWVLQGVEEGETIIID